MAKRVDYDEEDVAQREDKGSKGRVSRLFRKKKRVESKLAKAQDKEKAKESKQEEPQEEPQDEVKLTPGGPPSAAGSRMLKEEKEDKAEGVSHRETQAWRKSLEPKPEPLPQVDKSLSPGSRAGLVDKAAAMGIIKNKSNYVDNIEGPLDPTKSSSWVGRGGYNFKFNPGTLRSPPSIEVSGGLSGKLGEGEVRVHKYGDDIFTKIMERRDPNFDPADEAPAQEATPAQEAAPEQPAEDAGAAPVKEPEPAEPEGLEDQETGSPSVDVASDDVSESPVPVEKTEDADMLEDAINSDPSVAPIFNTINKLSSDMEELSTEKQKLVAELNELPDNPAWSREDRVRAIDEYDRKIKILTEQIQNKQTQITSLGPILKRRRDQLRASSKALGLGG